MYRKNKSDQLAVAASQNIKEREYWLKKLSGDLVKSYFPYDHQKNVLKDSKKDAVTFKFSEEPYSKLMALSNESDPRLHMILTAGLVLLLYKYTAHNDIIVGIPIYKQEIDAEFINTVLALRNPLQDNMTFKQLLLQVRQSIGEAVENQGYPIETLIYKLNMSLTGSDFPLFDTVVLLENIHEKKYIQHINHNMTFIFSRADEYIEGKLEYDSLLYEQTTVERIALHFNNVLHQALLNVNISLTGLDMLSEEEKKKLLIDFNDTEADFPKDKTIHRLFEEQVERTPGYIAVIGMEHGAWSMEKYLEGTRGLAPLNISYRELNKQSNQLAHLLQEKGVKADTIAAIMVERSLEMIIGILGIWKAGGVYLPLDPESPKNRILTMLEDSQAVVLLTKTTVVKQHGFTDLQGLRLIKTQPRLNSSRAQIVDFDGLPLPDRSLVDYEKYNPYIGHAMVKSSMTLQATRGCPYKCAYCHKIWPKKHVTRSAKNLFAEVELYYHMGVRRFTFIDDIFNLDVKNSTRFFEMLLENGLDVQVFFPNGLRGDLLTKEYIDMIVKAGTVGFALALETASPRLQKLIGKNLDLEKMHENLEYICKTYPHVLLELFTMHGFPTETEKEARMTLDYVKSLKWVHFPYLNILRIFRNTDMEKLALENGISPADIANSEHRAFHELPDTLPFDKNFTREYKMNFLNDYFLLKERLMQVLPYQMNILTKDELVQKYDSYMPVNIAGFDDLLEAVGIKKDELAAEGFIEEENISVPHLNEKIKRHFHPGEPSREKNALKVLLLDLSLFYSHDVEAHSIYDLVEPPLGLMYVMTYLNHQWGNKFNGKVAKSRIDFNNEDELKALLAEFKPDVIGIRTLTLYKDFFHQTVALIRQWGYNGPLIAGGPYATSDYKLILQDRNVDLVVLGEGEVTFSELIGKIMARAGKLPEEEVLNMIPGIAFISRETTPPNHFAREIIMLNQGKETLPGKSTGNIEHINQPDHLAYMIFTSGSTGRPKGVMIRHGSLVNRLHWMQKKYPLDANDTLLQKTPFTFDVSLWELFWWAAVGAKVYLLAPKGEGDPQLLVDAIEKQQITVIHFVPSMLNAFLDYVKNGIDTKRLSCLKQVFASGEALGISQVKLFNQLLYKRNHTGITNLYGPTEATVDVSYFDCPKQDMGKITVIPIGKPIDNIRLFVVNKNNQLQPVGVPGELCIAGRGLARGYLNNPGLTCEKFKIINYKLKIKNGSGALRADLNAFGDRFNEKLLRGVQGGGFLEKSPPGRRRLYITGDLARWQPDGNIEFLGRIDNQVKIRGFRIELAEIENQLLKHEQINEVIVTARENGDKYLCAYYVSEEKLTVPELRKHLLQELHDYMIPSYFIPLEKIPLTANGKVDRKALPGPGGKVDTGTVYIPPSSKIEEELLNIWQEVLHVEKIGMDDNLFDLGGNSILLLKLHSKINEKYPAAVNVVDLFTHTTIGKLAEFIENKGEYDDQKIELPILILPEAFFDDAQGNGNSRGIEENDVLTYSVKGSMHEKLKNISSREGIPLPGILLSIYIYMLAEITGKEEIVLHSMIMAENQLESLSINVSGIETLARLFQLTAQSLDNRETRQLSINRINDFPLSKEKHAILTLFYCKNLLRFNGQLTDIYDIVFEIDEQSDYIEFSYEFTNRLKKEKLEEMTEMYLKLLDVLTRTG